MMSNPKRLFLSMVIGAGFVALGLFLPPLLPPAIGGDTELSAMRFYREGTAPPGELCPLWCKSQPCCPPPTVE
jgi:hypothetical protein